MQIQLDRQKYLQERAGQDEAALRLRDERIPTGASRPMLSALEQAEFVVSAHVLMRDLHGRCCDDPLFQIHRTEGAEKEP